MHVYSVTKFNTLVKAQNNNENFKIQVQFFSKHILFYKLSNFATFPLVCDYQQIKIQFVVWLQSYLHTGHLWNDGFVSYSPSNHGKRRHVNGGTQVLIQSQHHRNVPGLLWRLVHVRGGRRAEENRAERVKHLPGVTQDLSTCKWLTLELGASHMTDELIMDVGYGVSPRLH